MIVSNYIYLILDEYVPEENIKVSYKNGITCQNTTNKLGPLAKNSLLEKGLFLASGKSKNLHKISYPSKIRLTIILRKVELIFFSSSFTSPSILIYGDII